MDTTPPHEEISLDMVQTSCYRGDLIHRLPPAYLRLAAVHLADSHRFRETNTDIPMNDILLKMRRIYHQQFTRYLRRLASGGLLLLTWFEGPYSCQYNESYFPTSCNLDRVPWFIFLIELIFVVYILLTSLAKLCFEGLYPMTKRRSFNYIVTICTFIHFLLVLLSFTRTSIVFWVFRNLFRPIYLADTFRAIRLLAKIHTKSLYKVFIPAVGMLILFVAFFSSFAQLFFGEYLDGDTSRNDGISYIKPFSNLFVMTTTTNFPDVALPAYKHNFFSYLFYVFFMTVVYFIVVRVLIAIFYDCYKEASREVTDNLIQHQNNHIIRAFGILREGEKYGTSRKSPSKSYTILQDDTISIQSVVDVTLTLFPGDRKSVV